jgi:hypothetical protein
MSKRKIKVDLLRIEIESKVINPKTKSIEYNTELFVYDNITIKRAKEIIDKALAWQNEGTELK